MFRTRRTFPWLILPSLRSEYVTNVLSLSYVELAALELPSVRLVPDLKGYALSYLIFISCYSITILFVICIGAPSVALGSVSLCKSY